ncbi:hypothetical protein ACWEQJ_34280 [Streptomyces cyaneofuscatus]
MIEGLAKAVMEPLATRWRNTALGTSLTLWLAALLVYVLTHPGATTCQGSSSPQCRIAETAVIGPGLLLVAGIGAVISTAFLAAGLAPGLFTLLTADSWLSAPAPLAWIGAFSVRLQRFRRNRLMQFTGRTGGSSLTGQRRRARQADLRARYPRNDSWISASRCGNALSAVTERVDRKLGLDLTHVWGPLLTVLPDSAHSRLVAQSAVVLSRCQQLLVAVGGVALAPLFPLPWALGWAGACALCALAFRHGLLRETLAFAAQVQTTVIAHRIALYQAYGLPSPVGPEDELGCGRSLTEVLRSFDDGPPPQGVTYDWPAPVLTP